jgi:hypothetical protein
LQRWDILWLARYKARGFRRINARIWEGMCAVAFRPNNIVSGSGDSQGVLKARRSRYKTSNGRKNGVPVAAL